MSVPGPTYELRELKKVFADGTVAVDGISLTVGPGEQIAVIGPSGAGKTTLFRLLNLTLRPTSGSLGIAGLDMAGLSDQALRRQDRKSTRLNSSHSSISYAVFCLKKKKPYRLRMCPEKTISINVK